MPARRLVWTVGALADLEEIGDYIAHDKPNAARRWTRVLVATAEHAALLPLSGRRVPEVDRDDVREVIKRGYRVAYQLEDDQIGILAVIEGHRELTPELIRARRGSGERLDP